MAPPAAAAQSPPHAIQVIDAHNRALGAAANCRVPSSAVAHHGPQQWLQLCQGESRTVNMFFINMG